MPARIEYHTNSTGRSIQNTNRKASSPLMSTTRSSNRTSMGMPFPVLALFAVGDVYVSICKKKRLHSI